MNTEGSLIIISAPSGTGKTSLVTAACKQLNNIQKSISHTTRDKRPGEVDGIHYNFVTKQQFDQIMAAGVFLEQAEVFGSFYGTSRDWVLSMILKGIDVILEIDWQGAQQIRERMPDTVSIFVLPPSDKALRERLINRNQDNEEKIALRLEQAKIEVSHYTEYEYLIVNDDFELALQELIAIISAARLRVSKQKQTWHELINQLCEKP